MASAPITSWQIEGDNVEAVTHFFFLGSKIIVDGECSNEIRWLLRGWKAMTNLDSVFKTRGHYSANKTLCSQGCGLPNGHLWLWKVDHKKGRMPKKIDEFELWCWRRLLKVPWTVKRSNQSIFREINPAYSLEGLMLKLQYFGHMMWTAD